MEGSNSNINPRNKSHDRPISRNYGNNHYNAQYNLDNNNDYLLFIWFASLKRYEDYIYLFIIVWNSPKFDNIERSVEFSDEISQMNNYIEELFTNNVISKQEMKKYSSLLDDFRDHSYNNPEAKKELVKGVSNKLEKYEISKYKSQLHYLKHFQKKHIRQMILIRMESFVDITRQTHVVDEEKTDLSSDNPIELRKEIESLRKQISNLARENSHYQAALGNMTNTRLSDQDPNSATRLISDIKDLQHLLEEFTIVQGPEYKINERKSMELFSKKKCQIDFSKPNAKMILGGILQQCIINQILEDVDSYFNDTNNRNLDETVEVEILNTTEKLIQSFNHFDENRPGNDITQTVPTKIRQQIYAALGSSGFSNDNHPLIVGTAKKIRELMDRYRVINDQDILSEIDSQSIQITRKVISIFYFRLKTQHIIPTCRFFESGEEIDTRLMQGSWSEEIKKLEVEVCYFPCVMISNSNSSEQKIFTKAQVYARPKKTIATTTGTGARGISAFDKSRIVNFINNK